MALDQDNSVSNLYADYRAWKAWDAPFTFTEDHAGYFENELRDLNIDGADVLEIGFGCGNCLAWLAQNGARISGTEISKTSCQLATEFGANVLPTDLPSNAEKYAGHFDTIIAFDVFEHLSIGEVSSYLKACDLMLRRGGKLLLRFPNAQSPFGLQAQMGDPTHRTFLSKQVVELLIEKRNFSVERYSKSFQFAGKPMTMRWLKRRMRFAAQNSISGILSFVYASGIPYEPVVVLVLVRT